MDIWHWLNCNAPALQAVGGILMLITTVVSIVVLVRTMHAANRAAIAADKQAAAGDKQAAAADRQVGAAEAQATAALASSKLSEEQLGAAKEALQANRKQFRPILVVTELKQIGPSRRSVTVENQGLGPALDIRWQVGGEPSFAHHAYGPTLVLGPKCAFEQHFEGPAETKLYFIYVSAFGDEASTEVLVTDLLFTTRFYPSRSSRSQRID